MNWNSVLPVGTEAPFKVLGDESNVALPASGPGPLVEYLRDPQYLHLHLCRKNLHLCHVSVKVLPTGIL